MWKRIIQSFTENPRDIKTNPLTRKTPLWFYAYVENGKLFVDRAKTNTPSSNLSKRRLVAVDEKTCNAMYDIYLRRKRGESVSAEAGATTVNQVYWYGIFADLENKD